MYYLLIINIRHTSHSTRCWCIHKMGKYLKYLECPKFVDIVQLFLCISAGLNVNYTTIYIGAGLIHIGVGLIYCFLYIHGWCTILYSRPYPTLALPYMY